MQIIKEFQGPFRFLSNFGDGEAEYDNVVYKGREYAYQAAKALPNFSLIDLDEKGEVKIVNYREAIKACETSGKAKRLGKRAKLRPGWYEMRYAVMEEIVYNAFSRNLELKKELLGTGEAILQEGNLWGDTYWGIDLRTGKGENNLGKILLPELPGHRAEDAGALGIVLIRQDDAGVVVETDV
jgi:predicted NAD-dependent protein-ADP-ribosyltransferase YbiA (DUF1768 family)